MLTINSDHMHPHVSQQYRPTFSGPITAPFAVVAYNSSMHGDAARLGVFLRRGRMLEDTFDAMAAVPVKDWSRSLMVNFEGEIGLDYG